MKKLNLIMAMLFTVVITASTLNAANEPQDRTKTFSVSKGGKLSINVNPGDIFISTWDKNEVVVKVSGLDEDDLKEIEMRQSGGNVEITYSSNWGWSSDAGFYITVPYQYNADVKTTGGDIRFKNNIMGNVNADSQGGDIIIMGVKGTAVLATQGGDVRTGDVSGDISVNTMGGDIVTGVLGGKILKLSTQGGDIRITKAMSGLTVKTYGGEIVIGDVGGSSDIRTYGGDIRLANVNGSLNMETGGGDIVCKNVKGGVKAKTGGGDVRMETVNGSLNIKSGAGDVVATLIPDQNSSSYISVGSGDIWLTLPSDTKATVEAVIRVQGRWKTDRESYGIRSDFQSKIYNENAEDKEIKAVYEINGGGSKISLYTTNSDITIKKSK